MLNEQLDKLRKEFGINNSKSIAFGYPNLKAKLVLPILDQSFVTFEQFQPILIYFDFTGISLFPLDIEKKYQIKEKIFIAWNDLKDFKVKKRLFNNKLIMNFESGKIELNLAKYKLNSPWVKENNQYLEEHDYFAKTFVK